MTGKGELWYTKEYIYIYIIIYIYIYGQTSISFAYTIRD